MRIRRFPTANLRSYTDVDQVARFRTRARTISAEESSFQKRKQERPNMTALPNTSSRTGRTSDRIAITYQPIGELTLDPNNPRLHSPKQIGQIARSITTFGFNVPVLVDADSKVIAGHGRLLACRKLGWSEVPTICLDHLSDAQAKAYMIADNRLTENSTWDDTLLAKQLGELSVLDLDFNLEDIGFEMGEIDLRIEGLNAEGNGTDDPADVIPEPTSKPPVTKLGIFGYSDATGSCAAMRLSQAPTRH
jgi:hypothetical protein